MNNEPVAWLPKGMTLAKPKDLTDCIPLYTHPAKCNKCNDTEWVCENHPDQEAHKCSHCEGAGKPCECTHPAKTLTDEEIVNLYKETEADNGGIREFARAILRKAQKK